MGWSTKVDKKYKLRCPKCSYRYAVVAPEEPIWETCPVCGHGEEIGKFIEVKCQDQKV